MNEYNDRKNLQYHGWDVNKASRYNSGSETVRHSVCKTLVGHYAVQEMGGRVSFEVPHPDRGEIDVLIYGLDGAPIAVECETSPAPDVVESKLSRYVDGTPMRECYVLTVDNMPENITDAYEWIGEQI